MSSTPRKTYEQADAYASPWTVAERVRMLFWSSAWSLLCAWTPKPLNRWRLLVLRLFGADLRGTPFVHPKARIQIPWKLHMEHRACLGDRAVAYTLGDIYLAEGATVAQEAYICTGTHDFSLIALPLQTAPIRIGAQAFIGARAFILPGITVGEYGVVGAGSVVTKDVQPFGIVAGNPARPVATRPTPR